MARTVSTNPSPLSRRSGGVLLHVTSLPGRWGVGDLGPAARGWVDLLSDAGQTWWQVLPLNPPCGEHSPYQSFSAFAGNPLLISLDDLAEDGLLRADELRPPRCASGTADYPRAMQIKTNQLTRAGERFLLNRKLRPAFDRFCEEQKDWLDDSALFIALRAANGHRAWIHWSNDLVCRKPAALRSAREELSGQIAYQKFLQFVFDRQLQRLRKHAKRRGVKLIGDLPIFVSDDSADVWTHPHLFQLTRDRTPAAVAGVPPDMFSATGQRWGNPLYDWAAMSRHGYAWWVARLRAALRQCDLIRLDHFRGFETYWRVPADATDARTDRWVKGPGAALFETFERTLGKLPLIAEDLGMITPDVERLRDAFALPGMRVLQFGVGVDDPTSPHLPHNFVANCVVYPGTHDNDTTLGWYRALDRASRSRVQNYLDEKIDAAHAPWAITRLAWASVARLAIVAMQDVLALPTSARMNTPGTHHGNWRWRLADFSDAKRGLERLAGLSMTYGRHRS